MNLRKAALVALVSVLTFLSSGAAQARGGWGWGFGLGFGVAAAAALPYWAGRPYYYPYYAPAYYPYYGYAPHYGYAPFYAGYAPAAYVQYSAPQQPAGYFYCPSANGYYPYVRQCASRWQRIPVTPVGA